MNAPAAALPGSGLASDRCRRPVHAFALVDGEGRERAFDPRRAIEIAAWLRHAAHEGARRLRLDAAFVEGFVCGHGGTAAAKNDRFSYLPLPHVGPRRHDGRIRQVLVAEPFGGGGGKAQAVARRLCGASLVAEGTGAMMAALRAVSDLAEDGLLAQYLPGVGARRWGSVTPLVLPGRDDRCPRKAERLVLKALAQAGYAAPVAELHLQPEPIFPGAEPARAYRAPAYLTDFPRVHAIITFAEPLPGPLALGAGRHVGLGLFAAMP